MIFYFVLWILISILFSIIFIHRIYLTSELFHFSVEGSSPINICSKINKYILIELILHTIFTLLILAVPYRSIIFFLINLPLVIRGWYLYKNNQFYFSPFSIVKNTKRNENINTMHIFIYIFTSMFLVYQLLITFIDSTKVF